MSVKNKMIIAASVLLMAGAVHTASANNGIIKFSGAISSSTCNMNLSVNGVVSPTGVAPLGIYKASDVSGIGEFGNQMDLSLVPEAASCDVLPGGSDAMVTISSSYTDETNTNVVLSNESLDTNVGVLFQLKSGTQIVNQSAVALTSGSDDLSADGSINFTAQPYALSATVNPGVIGGVVQYSVAYL